MHNERPTSQYWTIPRAKVWLSTSNGDAKGARKSTSRSNSGLRRQLQGQKHHSRKTTEEFKFDVKVSCSLTQKRKKQHHPIINYVKPSLYQAAIPLSLDFGVQTAAKVELKISRDTLGSHVSEQVFVEGEFYEIAAYWHMLIPCVYNADSDCFLAAVELADESKFHFVIES